MNRDKQIDEMAMIMTEGARPATEDAEALYNAGYRKTFTSEFASDTQKAFKEGYITAIGEVASEIFGKLERANLVRLTDDYWKIKEQYTEVSV